MCGVKATADAEHGVTYATPGCNVATVACACRTGAQAETEAAQLNLDQVTREEVIQRERELRGFRRTASSEVR